MQATAAGVSAEAASVEENAAESEQREQELRVERVLIYIVVMQE